MNFFILKLHKTRMRFVVDTSQPNRADIVVLGICDVETWEWKVLLNGNKAGVSSQCRDQPLLCNTVWIGCCITHPVMGPLPS